MRRECEIGFAAARMGAGKKTQGMGFVFNSCTSDDLLVQQRCGWAGARGCLRREDCEFVKHDKLFSKWKILVGPSDWTEHTSGKADGTGKYNVHNLPATQFGPGVYELGVTAPSWSPTSHSQRTRTLKREDVIAVYVGHAANVRQPLQKYGQAGAHLEAGSRSSKLYQGDYDSFGSRSPRIEQSGGREAKSPGSGPRLFSEVFALGSSIAFRWAHTDSKVVAEQVESELLAVFDYAWNKGISGTRRSRDILAKLFMAWPTKDNSFWSLMFSGKRSPWLLCGTNAVGIKVALRKPQDSSTSTKSNRGMMGNLCFLMAMQPQVPVKVASSELRCGVVTGNGMPCNAPPLRGRKRCLQHYEIKQLRVITPAAGFISPSLSTAKQINVGSVKLQAEPVKAKSYLPKGFLGREYFFPTKTRKYCNEAVPKEKQPVERSRRRNSLSFNTWVKGEVDQRVHDSPDPTWSNATNKNESTYAGTKQENGQPASGMSVTPKRRVRQVGSKYASLPADDSKWR